MTATDPDPALAAMPAAEVLAAQARWRRRRQRRTMTKHDISAGLHDKT